MYNIKEETRAAYIFLLPALIGFVVLLMFPLVFSFFLSFNKWNLLSGFQNIQFVGIRNYLDIWKDEWFVNSLKNNFFFTIVVVPLTMAISLGIALILNNKVHLKGLIRLLFFIPYISSLIAVSVVFMALYHPTMGPINQFLFSVGIENPPKWLADPDWALFSIMLMVIWKGLGFNLIVYLAGLQNIPSHLYEAAEIDGANGFRKFFYITVPMLSPTTFFLLVTRIIHSFQVFGPINIMTQGGPAQSTSVLVYYIYKSAFSFYQMGYASAMSWILLIIILVITLIQWKGQRKWVNND